MWAHLTITSQAAAWTVPRHVRDRNSARINPPARQSVPDRTARVHCEAEAMPMGSMITSLLANRRQATCDSQLQCSLMGHRTAVPRRRPGAVAFVRGAGRPAARRWSLTRHLSSSPTLPRIYSVCLSGSRRGLQCSADGYTASLDVVPAQTPGP